eukprot:scaffold90807_cov30-Phaeocystis_antarctica.AAC.1
MPLLALTRALAPILTRTRTLIPTLIPTLALALTRRARVPVRQASHIGLQPVAPRVAACSPSSRRSCAGTPRLTYDGCDHTYYG